MGKRIITTILEKLKLINPSKDEKGNYILMLNNDKEVCAVPINAVLSTLNKRVDQIVYPDGFTKVSPISIVGNEITIPAGDFEWKIELNPYKNILFEQVIAETSDPAFNRIDSLAATKENTIVYYQGQEVDETEIAIPPVVPSGELRLTDIYVLGASIEEPVAPPITEVFTKEEKEKLAILDPTSDADKPVSTAQAAADATVLATANAYTDAKVSGVYVFKGNKTDYADLVATGEQVNGYVYNLIDTDKNYAWNGSSWDDIGGTFDISGKEDASNKTDDETTSITDTTKYFSVKGFWNAILNKLFLNTPAKATALVDADTLALGDSEDGGKTKTRTWAQIKASLLAYFQNYFAPKSPTIIETGTSFTLDDTYNGKILILTASCTVTLPNGLVSGFGITIVTLASVTLTLATGGSVTLANNAGTTMGEKLSCTIQNRTAANSYITAGNL